MQRKDPDSSGHELNRFPSPGEVELNVVDCSSDHVVVVGAALARRIL